VVLVTYTSLLGFSFKTSELKLQIFVALIVQHTFNE